MRKDQWLLDLNTANQKAKKAKQKKNKQRKAAAKKRDNR